MRERDQAEVVGQARHKQLLTPSEEAVVDTRMCSLVQAIRNAALTVFYFFYFLVK